jgi:hypothetical protein
MTYTGPATITWDDGVNPPLPFTLSSDALNSLEAYRLSILTAPGGQPKYAAVVDLIQAYLNQYCVIPAIQINEPPSVVTARQAYEAALLTAITEGQIH